MEMKMLKNITPEIKYVSSLSLGIFFLYLSLYVSRCVCSYRCGCVVSGKQLNATLTRIQTK